MKWRFEDILTFLDVVDAGSITAAAARSNISKSIVSKRISDLETALDVELFRRSTGRVVPTEAGQAFCEQVRPLVAEISETAERISGRQAALRGRLRITAPMTFGTMYLGPVVAEFARQNPDLELALDYDDRVVDLVRHGYDVGIRIGNLQDSGLVARRLCGCRRVVCCSPDYARSRGLPKTIADLTAHDCIDYAHVHTSQLWQFEGRAPGKKPRSIVMRSRIVANNGEAMRDAALAGLGLVMLPMFIAAPSLREGTLIPALPRETPVPYSILGLYPPTRHLSTKVRAFVDHLARHFAEPSPWEKLLRADGSRKPKPID